MRSYLLIPTNTVWLNCNLFSDLVYVAFSYTPPVDPVSPKMVHTFSHPTFPQHLPALMLPVWHTPSTSARMKFALSDWTFSLFQPKEILLPQLQRTMHAVMLLLSQYVNFCFTLTDIVRNHFLFCSLPVKEHPSRFAEKMRDNTVSRPKGPQTLLVNYHKVFFRNKIRQIEWWYDLTRKSSSLEQIVKRKSVHCIAMWVDGRFFFVRPNFQNKILLNCITRCDLMKNSS